MRYWWWIAAIGLPSCVSAHKPEEAVWPTWRYTLLLWRLAGWRCGVTGADCCWWWLWRGWQWQERRAGPHASLAMQPLERCAKNWTEAYIMTGAGCIRHTCVHVRTCVRTIIFMELAPRSQFPFNSVVLVALLQALVCGRQFLLRTKKLWDVTKLCAPALRMWRLFGCCRSWSDNCRIREG